MIPGLVFLLALCVTTACTSHVRKAHSYLDLRIKLSPTNGLILCEEDQACAIPYAISVLRSPNHFDLLSIMMQDGSSLNYNHNRYSDSTVVRLTKAMKQHNDKIYLGFRFFDLPEGMQDYVIMDATAVIASGKKTKVEIITEGYRLGLQVTKEMEMSHALGPATNHRNNEVSSAAGNTSHCACELKNCACCMMFNIPKIKLHDVGCVNVTYISEDIGLRLSFSINGHIYVSKELSIRNPPPYCFTVPYLKEYASICLRLRKLDVRQKHVDGCVDLDAELYHVHVATVHVGCFSVPI